MKSFRGGENELVPGGGQDFDPVTEGRQFGLSDDVSREIWARIRASCTDGTGRVDEDAARRSFHSIAERAARQGGRLHPEPGRLTLSERHRWDWGPSARYGITTVAPGKLTRVMLEYPSVGAAAVDELPGLSEVKALMASMSPGSPTSSTLDPSVRARMEPLLGADLSDVKVHTDSSEMSGGTKALAREGEVHFAAGEYRPGTQDGDRIIAHELAHVVQRRGGDGGREGTRAELEAEAEYAASQVVRGERASIRLTAAAGAYAYTEGDAKAPPQGAQPNGPQNAGLGLAGTEATGEDGDHRSLVARISQIHDALQVRAEEIRAVIPAYVSARDALDTAAVADRGGRLIGALAFVHGAKAALAQLVPQVQPHSAHGSAAAEDAARARTLDLADPATSGIEDRLRQLDIAVAGTLTPHYFRGEEVAHAFVIVDIEAVPPHQRINRLYGELERTTGMLELVRDLQDRLLHQKHGLARASLDAARAEVANWASRPLDLAFLRAASGTLWNLLDATANGPTTSKPSDMLRGATEQAKQTGWLGDIGRFDLEESCNELRRGGRENAEWVLRGLYTADPDTRAKLLMKIRERGLLDALCSAVGWSDIKDLHDSLGFGYSELKTELQHYFLGPRKFGPSLGAEWENHDSSLHSLIAKMGGFGKVANFVVDVGTFGFASSYGKALDDNSHGMTSEVETRQAKLNAMNRAALVAAVSILSGGLAGAAVRGRSVSVSTLRAVAAGAASGGVGAIGGLAASDTYGLATGQQQHFSSIEDYVTAALLGGSIGGAVGGGMQALRNWRLGPATRSAGAAGSAPVVEDAPAPDPVAEAFEANHPRIAAAGADSGFNLRGLSPMQKEMLTEAESLLKGDIHKAMKLFDHLRGTGVEPTSLTKMETSLAKSTGTTDPQVYRQPHASLPSGKSVDPSVWGGARYYGSSGDVPAVVFEEGLPARGQNINLLDHVHQKGDSAFRGTTTQIFEPSTDGEQSGAGAWAGEGGYVYKIDGTPSWDVNVELEGRVPKPDGTYGNNPLPGEHEHAILAGVPRERIVGAYQITRLNGRLIPGKLIPNPHYQALR